MLGIVCFFCLNIIKGVGFEVFALVVTKVAMFYGNAPCSPCGLVVRVLD
jgi:hypothetical protein